MKRLLTTAELARKWNLTPARIKQFVAEGRVRPAVHIPRSLLLFDPRTPRPRALSRRNRRARRQTR